MKKRLLTTTMALAMAFTAAMSGMGTLTVHATPPAGYDVDVDDGCYRGDGREGESGFSTGGISIGGGSSDSVSSSSNPSSSSSSYDDGAYHGNGREGESGFSTGSISIGDSGASYSAPAPTVAGNTTGVTGKEQYRAMARSGAGTYKVTHKGIDIATFTLMDAETKKSEACTAVFLKQREDGKWAIEFQVTEHYAETTKAADTTGLTVGAPLDRTYLYNTLGISYVTINDAIVIDIEAEAAAAK